MCWCKKFSEWLETIWKYNNLRALYETEQTKEGPFECFLQQLFGCSHLSVCNAHSTVSCISEKGNDWQDMRNAEINLRWTNSFWDDSGEIVSRMSCCLGVALASVFLHHSTLSAVGISAMLNEGNLFHRFLCVRRLHIGLIDRSVRHCGDWRFHLATVHLKYLVIISSCPKWVNNFP